MSGPSKMDPGASSLPAEGSAGKPQGE
jgi:hypothetical protein